MLRHLLVDLARDGADDLVTSGCLGKLGDGMVSQVMESQLCQVVLSISGFELGRWAAYRGLKALERAGLVSVARRPGRKPIVTLRAWIYPNILCYEPFCFEGRIDEFAMAIDYGKKVYTLEAKKKVCPWDAEFRDWSACGVKGQP
jgi:hypothetical protein